MLCPIMEWLWGGLLGWGLSLLSGGVYWGVRRRQEFKSTERIVAFLTQEYTGREGRPSWASTQTISSKCHLADDRVRALCIRETRIRRSTGDDPDKWGLRAVVGEVKVPNVMNGHP